MRIFIITQFILIVCAKKTNKLKGLDCAESRQNWETEESVSG